MLCLECSKICLQLDFATSEGILLRQYDNLPTLKSAALSCDLCSLLSESMSWIFADDIAPYCRSQWGEELWQHLVATSKISIYHVCREAGNHNIEIHGSLDARSSPGYKFGPPIYYLDTCLGGISIAEDSPYSHLVHGRPATLLADRKTTITALKAKYDACVEHHELCQASRTTQFVPPRLVKILEDKIVIIETSSQSLQYATLSYCWGGSNTVQLTSNSLDLYRTEGVQLNQLPLTIRDAIEVCAGIGINYIWIDCLCILQDSNKDWVTNFTVMTTIYNSSMLNIKASAKSKSKYALLEQRSVLTQHSVEIRCQTEAGIDQMCLVREPLDHQHKGIAESRAWILQEDLLSRRTIVFTPSQVLWQCCSSVWTESGISLQEIREPDWIFPRWPLQEWHCVHLGGRQSRISLPDWKHSRLWERIVRDYCSRQLTFLSDKFPAVSGIADWISTHPSFDAKSRYLAGLWEAHLPGCLLWYQTVVLPTYTDKSRIPLVYRAPSWTWAANDGTDLTWLDWRKHKMIAKVTAFETQLQDFYQFGRVLGGSIDLTTQIKRGSFIQQSNRSETFRFCDENSSLQTVGLNSGGYDSSLGMAYFDSIEYNKAWLGYDVVPDHRPWTCECIRISETAGLLVEPINDKHCGSLPTYRRIGLVDFFHASDWWMSSLQASIRLV